jgi:hypothetical protein
MTRWHIVREQLTPERQKLFEEWRCMTLEEARALFSEQVLEAIAEGFVIINMTHDDIFKTGAESFFIGLHKEEAPNLVVWATNVEPI